MGMHLESSGHEAVFAFRCGKALAQLKQHHIDSVVTDILMPEVEGIEFVLSARRLGYELPIIAMTGGSAGQGAATSGHDFLKIARDLGRPVRCESRSRAAGSSTRWRPA